MDLELPSEDKLLQHQHRAKTPTRIRTQDRLTSSKLLGTTSKVTTIPPLPARHESQAAFVQVRESKEYFCSQSFLIIQRTGIALIQHCC